MSALNPFCAITAIFCTAPFLSPFTSPITTQTPPQTRRRTIQYPGPQAFPPIANPFMQFIAASLGVECEFCHVEHANDKDDKSPKLAARK